MGSEPRRTDTEVQHFLEYISEKGKPEWEQARPLWQRIATTFLPYHVRSALRFALTRAVMPIERHRAGRLAHSGLWVHLGSGKRRKAGWVNIDLAGQPVDLMWDLRYPLPMPEGAADVIFHEHLLEHLPLETGLFVTRECYRVLKPGGVLRIGVPDAERYLRSYISESDEFLDSNRPNRPTRLLALQEVFYEYGHRTMYDYQTLNLLFRSAGFVIIRRASFGKSEYLAQPPDSEDRRSETLYVETVK
jgi:predicted SAM-dependent methyltransferase